MRWHTPSDLILSLQSFVFQSRILEGFQHPVAGTPGIAQRLCQLTSLRTQTVSLSCQDQTVLKTSAQPAEDVHLF